MSTSTRAQTLRALVALVSAASETVISEWEKEDILRLSTPDQSRSQLPSWELYNARRTLIAASGTFTELVHDPQTRIMEVSAQFLESRALHVAVEHRIADVIASQDKEGCSEGVPIGDIADKIGVNASKLARLMRALTSAHIFQEVGTDRFENNRISECLVNNELLRSWVLMSSIDTFNAACKLPDVLRDHILTHSTSTRDAAMCKAVHTDGSYWDWLEAFAEDPDGGFHPNPSMEVFTHAMSGQGEILARAVCYDYPWATLEDGLVVDVGGGAGSMSLALAKVHPKLRFVIQDRPPLQEKATALWSSQYPEGSSRMTFMAHDFFIDNPVRNADVYMLRFVLHDWHDEECIIILKRIRGSMSPRSRILVIDPLMNTTLGSVDVANAPGPLPANYGTHTRAIHNLDMMVLALVNGLERRADQLSMLATRAGLEVVKVWECRGGLSITEMQRASTQSI